MDQEQLVKALNSMILSSSGWRRVFAEDGQDESMNPNTGKIGLALAYGAAFCFGSYVQRTFKGNASSILLGTDSRPTGPNLAAACAAAFQALGLSVEYSGIAAVPEFLADCARTQHICGFFYISASHNPAGHNGFKFGLGNGAILGGGASAELIAEFKTYMQNKERPWDLLLACLPTLEADKTVKERSFHNYMSFTKEVACGSGNTEEAQSLYRHMKQAILREPLGVCIDFNGSARIASIDQYYLQQMGAFIHIENGMLGKFAHGIVPEGSNLEPCRLALQKAAQSNKSFQFGYMPDCDGDRGNLVVFNAKTGQAESLEAQTVFALCAVSELAWLKRAGFAMEKTAMAVNDATSLRIEAICRAFGANLFVAETGEANVVSLAALKRAEGLEIRLLGEGSNGGNITYPAPTRDPLNTLTSFIKLLYLRDSENRPGLFHTWLDHIGKPYNGNFTLADVINSLPAFTTTSVFEPEALIKTVSPMKELKAGYEKLFEKAWPTIKELLKPLSAQSYEIRNYESSNELIGKGKRSGDETGGFKVLFLNSKKQAKGFFWLRGSKTEPITRLMVDLEGCRPELELKLRAIHRQLIDQADAGKA